MSPPLSSPSLATLLAAYAHELRTSGSPYASEYDRLIDRLQAGELGQSAPQVGDAFPPFVLSDQAGRMICLEDLLAEGALVVSFNRGHWCPFCLIELAALDEAHASLASLGARLVSIMPDRQPYTRELAATFKHPVTILTDMDNAYAMSLGLAMWVGAAVRDLEIKDGTPMSDYHGNDHWVLPLPATFVVSQAGIILARYVNPDFRERMEINDILASLAAKDA